MQRNVFAGFVVCLVVVTALLCWQQRPTAAADNTSKEATVWEYKAVDDDGGAVQEKTLNTLGREGWELIYVRQNVTNTYVFKRPKSK